MANDWSASLGGAELSEPRPGRVILVSNRLPVSVHVERGRLSVERSSGGLATGLAAHHESAHSIWVGWPGETWRLTPEQLSTLESRLGEMRAAPVYLTANDLHRYYNGFSNGVLWPLLHYQIDKLPLEAQGWDAYQRVNRLFADAVEAVYRPGDLIWVHDYQLALVPRYLRERIPDAPIGYFLHVPFPSAEVFRLLPWRRELLEGMLGASLIGFHTVSYVLHFLTSAANVLAAETHQNRILFDGRSIRVGTFPMGIDASQFAALGSRPEVLAEADRLRAGNPEAALIVSVDRLDYTKGIGRRLLAFERLLERYPSLRGHVRLVQVAAPSRSDVPEYRGFQRSVNEMVGRINGRFAAPGYDPIHYISQNLGPESLAALYLAAAAALITPLRDGMNLVAKEFVATRVDGDGVLILSEFAGAAAELSHALLVNPYDLDNVAGAIHEALAMPEAERRRRMAGLRERVRSHDVHRWAAEFEAALRAEARRAERGESPIREAVVSPGEVAAQLLSDPSRRLVLLLDYDGTLVGIRPSPDEASPDAEILRILAALATLPAVQVHVVSGRRREEMELWLGSLPIRLHAEHGLYSRTPDCSKWVRRDVRPSWMGKAREIMARRAEAVPDSLLEEKEASLTWHYRRVAVRLGRREATSLKRELEAGLRGTTATVMMGRRIVEVKDEATDKGLIVRELTEADPGARMLLTGDDVTDESMFEAAPDDAVTVHIGGGTTLARMRLAGPDQVRKLLQELIEKLEVRIKSPGPAEDAPDGAAGPNGPYGPDGSHADGVEQPAAEMDPQAEAVSPAEIVEAD